MTYHLVYFVHRVVVLFREPITAKRRKETEEFSNMPNVRSLILTAALAALSVSAAQADLKVVQTTLVDSPQLDAYMQTMTPQQRAQMAHSGSLLGGGPQQTVIFAHGPQTRVDIGGMTYLVNSATHRTIVLNRRNHTYTTRPYQSPGTGGAGQIQATVKDTGQTKTISGHPARRYMMNATVPSQPGTIIHGDIWAALDIPQPTQIATGSGPFAAIQNQFRKVKGYPLKTSLAVTGSPMGDTTINSSVVSVSKASLPASVFAIPAGYTKSSGGEGEGM